MKKILHSNLRLKAKELRKEILNSINSAKKGHIGGSFSCLDILISLFYAKVFNLGKKYINNSNRDFFILSKGFYS